jgi:hypothetical protein
VFSFTALDVESMELISVFSSELLVVVSAQDEIIITDAKASAPNFLM